MRAALNGARAAALLACVVALAACSSGQSAIEPAFKSTPLQTTSQLQFAVGTANLSGFGLPLALNTVVTFRQPNGLSATLVNTPSIVGPSGLTVPGGAGLDSGTNHITGSPQVTNGPTNTTFGQAGGAFSYGFLPANEDTNGTPSYAQYSGGTYNFAYAQPIYNAQANFLGGPPAFPDIYNGSYPPGFAGYPPGFTMFAVAPVAGQYTLTVTVASANTATSTFSASGTLSNTNGLPAYPAPVYTSDGTGGGTVAIAPPSGVTETLVYIQDTTTHEFFTLYAPGGGAATLTLPDTLGAKGGLSIPAGDVLNIYAVGYDYPAFEASPPGNAAQTPAIVGSGGQSDLTIGVSAATE